MVTLFKCNDPLSIKFFSYILFLSFNLFNFFYQNFFSSIIYHSIINNKTQFFFEVETNGKLILIILIVTEPFPLKY